MKKNRVIQFLKDRMRNIFPGVIAILIAIGGVSFTEARAKGIYCSVTGLICIWPVNNGQITGIPLFWGNCDPVQGKSPCPAVNVIDP